MNWQKIRKWNRNIHRDLGYLCFGLTIIYAVSGVAVNHVEDWNPNYRITRQKFTLAPVEPGSEISDRTVRDILKQLKQPLQYKSYFRSDPRTLKIFIASNTLTVDLPTGAVVYEKVKTRPLIYESNFLHLNHPKKLWTYFADLYAVSLALLAISGLFILKGKNGITGRGAWLTATGILLPILFLWLYL